jgi:hypothetical protein
MTTLSVKDAQTTPRPRPATYRLARARTIFWTVGKLLRSIFRFRMGWMFPLVLLLMVLALILLALATTGPFQPFLYPLY